MRTFLTILGIVLVVAGAVVSVFTGIPASEFVGVAVAMLGAAVVCSTTIKKAVTPKEKKLSVVAVALVAVGGFLLGCLGFTENIVTQVISAVAGVVALIIGMVVAYKASQV